MGEGARGPRKPLSVRGIFFRFYVSCVLHIAGLPSVPRSVRALAANTGRVAAVAGGDAALPCDSRPQHAADTLLLVVWYKNDTPIYSYDARAAGSAAHWADAAAAGERARWDAAALRLRRVRPADRALYRCRVDYRLSPTVNRNVWLDVIELPEKPKIFDDGSKEEIQGAAGPYVEDSSAKFTCAVSGGKPPPRVRWWRDDQVVSTLAPAADGSALSFLELRLERLSREYSDAVYTCTVDNTALVPPLRAQLHIQLYLRPLSVEILPHEQPLAVGQRAELQCRAGGARPPALLSWWIGHAEMTPAAAKTSDDGNETLSVLRWTPRMDQNGMRLTCRAAHAVLQHAVIETYIMLNLHYIPIVSLKLGSNMNPNDIEEGDDVYFDCIIKSHPRAYKVIWEHNNQLMSHSTRAGVIATSAHLALQKVSRQQAGKYTCTASNVEGDGKSEPVTLQVIYKPTCKQSTVPIVGVALNELARVTCEVDAYPPPLAYHWALNNSLGIVEIDPDKFTVEDSRSVLTVRPTSESDYGWVWCSASNLAGRQAAACRYLLQPAAAPRALAACAASNLTADAVDLACTAGYDGGLHTIYFVEVWESKKLIQNVSTGSPLWKLRGLDPGKTIKLVFYASNARGRSETTSLRIHTLKKLGLYEGSVDTSWVLGTACGAGGTLLAVMLVALLLRTRRRCSAPYAAPSQGLKTYTSNNGNNSPPPADDKNPDVVPLGKDVCLSSEPLRPPSPPPYGVAVAASARASLSTHSLQHDIRSLHTPNTPVNDAQSMGVVCGERRGRREIVTTRTPLLAHAKESCV